MTQTCGCHHRTESKNKLDLHLECLFVGKIITSGPGGGYSCGWTVNLGAGLFLDLAFANYITGAKFHVLLFSYMEIRIPVPGLKVLLRRHNLIIILILQAEQRAEAGSTAAELP